MNWNALVRDRLREITGNAAHDAEIVEELADDLEQRFEERRRAGKPEEDALAAALEELADTDTLRARLRRERPASSRPPAPPAAESSNLLTGLASDIRYAARVLVASPGFAAAAILTLAIGIGAVVAIFSVIDAVLLKPVPYPTPSVSSPSGRPTATAAPPTSRRRCRTCWTSGSVRGRSISSARCMPTR
jgi:hypothetical protein